MPIKDCFAARVENVKSVIFFYKGNVLVETKAKMKVMCFSPCDHSY